MSTETSLSQDELRRVARQLQLPGFGLPQQERLHGGSVLVIGAGGLGCPLLQQLAAAGVGRITVIDADTVAVSNLHRQVLFGAEDVGRYKAEVAAERVRRLQPGIEVTVVRERFTAENALQLIAEADVLVDGADNFATKFLAADAAEITGTPLVWGTVLRFHGDVAVWHSGPGAPGGRGVGLRDLFPAQPAADSVPDCASAGVLGATTSVVAGLMATEVIKLLAGLPVQVGAVRSYEALAGSLRSVRVGADPQRELVAALGDYGEGEACAADPAGPAARQLLGALARGEALALDVREDHEKLLEDLPTSRDHPGLHLPWSLAQAQPRRVGELFDALPRGQKLVVYCASGRRSNSFVAAFSAAAHDRGISLRELPGGVTASLGLLAGDERG